QESFPTPTHGFSAPAGERAGPITSSRRSSYPHPGASRSITRDASQESTTTPDGTPIVPYIPTSSSARRNVQRQSSSAVRDRAEAIRRNQAAASEELRGQAHPPQDTYETQPDAQIENTQFNPSTYQNGQIPQPGAPQDQNTRGNQPVAPAQQVAPDQRSNSYGQQYPEPNTRSNPAPTRLRSHPARTQTPAQQSAPQQQQPPVNYPSYTQPLANPGYPNIPTPYPLATPPSDYQLQQKDVPPLRGYFDPRVDTTTPLSDRQQAEHDLATLEGSYSSWVGASVIGAYRSGTKGIDRMASVEVPFEASFALGKAFRFTVMPMPIFLDSGVLSPEGNLGAFPVFGTVLGTSVQTFPQQYSTGLGGEAQLTSATFSIAGGYSAYGFLVRNGIGRVRWRPGSGHFSLFGGRDPVKDTQLSYAGLRDPGQPNAFTYGPIWGGVVQTGGGVRVDAGNERSGLYMQAEGGLLTGYHVFQNRKYDGTFGAYFRAHVWPEYGSLNIGGAIFGEHYDYNERIESYGWGGYFSPNVYFLFAVPVTFNGHYKDQLHYSINGSVGVQTFQENAEPYYPLDQSLQLNLQATANCAGLAVGAS
ncbi:MAG: cellulose synthase subunit BcsC-related outer membrane protein, partial [Bryocella sp.]